MRIEIGLAFPSEFQHTIVQAIPRPLLHLRMDQLDAIAALPDQKIKAEQYRAVLQTVLAQKQAAECKGFVDHSKS